MAEDSYVLDAMISFDRERNLAPPALRHYMAARPDLRGWLQKCAKEEKIADIESYFGAYPLKLKKQGPRAYLAVPAWFCSPMHGGQTTTFWVMEEARGGGYRELLSYASAYLEVMNHVSHGYRDIGVNDQANTPPTRLRYDGKSYAR
jgi:hypothetical protein